MGKKKLLMLIKSDFSFSLIILDPVLLQKIQPSTGETQENMNKVSCCRDMTEILLKAAYNTIQSINPSKNEHSLYTSNS